MSQKNKKDPKPQIIPLHNGPYYYFTDFTPKEVDGIVNSREEKISNPKGTALCRCGSSKNKPFCDGTHWQIGFKDDKN